jgi:lantibiotic modifying enzyme
VLALAELVGEFKDPEQRGALEGGVRWLLSEHRLAGEPLSGLYVGEAGVAVALLRAGQVLGAPDLIKAASKLGKWVATLPHETPCIFTGTAGRLRHHLMLWDETADPDHLHFAMAAGERLLSQAEPATGDGLSWVMPNGHGVGTANLGYAHGAAGIGDALLDLYDATHDARYLGAAAGAARWIAALARPTLDESLGGLNWARSESTPLTEGFWCHGAGGIGLFLLRASQFGILDGAMEMAHRAAFTVGRAVRWAMPIHCHGLAGNIDFLLDLYQATGDASYLAEARTLGRLMRAYATELNGMFVWGCETPTKFSSTYTVGFSGIAMCLLRLSDPARRPQQLTRPGFKYRP